MHSDPQVWHLKDKYVGLRDEGGVHTNSGIPNHAFYLVAVTVGGRAWERAGQVWYDSLLRLKPHSNFEDCAKTTYLVGGVLYGRGSRLQKAVKSAWRAVGVSI
jgi:Zn-dependent metalloprotease